MNMTVNGELIAAGTPTMPIVFTVVSPKSGNRWGGLVLNNKQSVGSSTVLDNCIIEFAGISNLSALTLNNASVPIQNCLIRDNNTHGIRLINGSNPNISNNAILQNLSHGVFNDSGSDPVISNNSIFGNGLNGVFNNDPLVTVQAINNYWGDDTGPSDDSSDIRCDTFSNAGGVGDEVSDCVIYDPWVRLGPSVAGTVTAIAGSNQIGTVGQILPIPVEVEVLSTLGTPLQGIDVIFSIVQGDAAIIETMPVGTDINGRAMATIQLGNIPGEILIAATARDVNSPLASFLGEANAPCLFTMKVVALVAEMPLSTPENLQANLEPGIVELEWDAVDDAESYDVYRTEMSGGAFALLGNTIDIEYQDRTIVLGNYYSYRVQAVAGANRSEFSNEVEVNANNDDRVIHIDEAEWKQKKHQLKVKGEKAPANETVFIRDEFDTLIGTTTTNKKGKWRFKEVIEHVEPCQITVEINGYFGSRGVDDAPQHCEGEDENSDEDQEDEEDDD